ncbi:DUF3509 domain-containing protein [Pseudomonas monteilii]|mgnify:FL=1|jgi:hypothetical protein|uniref:DUF3509 domain-containing protein n=2 Tax=Pseudomonas putida group TaxID=136845 RepID=A0AAE6R9M2_9PSED|nr:MULTISPECIES: DUF3509 domain-containing protein [Pseudomonas]MBB3270587.1 hypothetical protein [Pseudomonas sp. OG7]MBH3396807.1 DUF3509 domain-containing protein [Pseudomonas monteilii]MBH3456969.1 DUF3509 domain-containing protein [Pseudomonas monteilii]MCJ7851196.1 DUF3509 domain-containing protein [Pseudomonas monteilii]MDD2122863.1 DUF3509 domain-containing protein [Pseudomonas monteilii]
MERICSLLNDALTPYQIHLGITDANGNRQLTVHDRLAGITLQRTVSERQLQEQRLLIDLVDGLHRDLQIAEGRLQPCVIAALQQRQQPQGTFA